MPDGHDPWILNSPGFGTTSSLARFWNSVGNGKDGLEADRYLAGQALVVAPDIADVPGVSDRFKLAAARYLVGQGIDQFIDCNPGTQVVVSAHRAVQEMNPKAQVVYVNDDQIVLAHARALLATNDLVEVVAADPFDAGALRDLTKHVLDWSRPVALLQVGTLQHRPDADEVMKSYLDVLGAGSYLVVSCWERPAGQVAQRTASQLAALLTEAFGYTAFRHPDEIAHMVSGYKLVPPGIVSCTHWSATPSESQPSNWLTEHTRAIVCRKT